MFFLFIVFGCRAIAGPCRGFEMCRQISRFRGIISRLGQLKFAVRAVTGTSRKIAVSALSLPFPCQRVGREEIYPAGRYGSTSQGTSNPLSKTVFRQMSRAASGPNLIFSLHFPVRQGKLRLTPRSIWPGGGGGRWRRSIARGRAGLLRGGGCRLLRRGAGPAAASGGRGGGRPGGRRGSRSARSPARRAR